MKASEKQFKGSVLFYMAVTLLLGGTCFGDPDPTVDIIADIPDLIIARDTGDQGATDDEITLTADIDRNYIGLYWKQEVSWSCADGGTITSPNTLSTTFSSTNTGYFTITCSVEFDLYGFPKMSRVTSVTIEVEDPAAPAPEWRDGTLSQGRKISLPGMPMPDVAEHQEGESDYEPEETYVDALTLDLQHSVTDIHVPVGSDHFALEVRRSLGQEVWTTNSLPFKDRLDLPFGPCWSSPISPTLEIVNSGVSFKTFIATDHNGQTYTQKGGMWWNEEADDIIPTFYMQPSTSQSALALRGVDMKISDWESNTVVVLTLKNGTAINYHLDPTVEFGVRAHPVGGGTDEGRNFYRALSVVDRVGNTLAYGYNESNTGLIPNTIESSSGQKFTITPSADGKRVERIEDPMGNYVEYFYTNGFLRAIERMDGGKTSYTYTETLEEDDRGLITNESDVIDYHHLTIEHIVDANQNTNTFAFATPERFIYSQVVVARTNDFRLDRIGLNRILTSITRPDGSEVLFEEANDALGTIRAFFGAPYKLSTDRTNVVTDVNNQEWSYVFSDPHETDPLASGWASNVRLFEYKRMDIHGPEGARESYRYGVLGVPVRKGLDPLVILAQTNFSGQSTTYAYDPVDDGCYKPSSVANALGGVKHSEYLDLFGYQLKSTINELEQVTTYGFDDVGNRTSETNFSAGGVVLAIRNMEYANNVFSNFMTKQIIVDLNNPVSNLVTTFSADDYGKMATKTIYPDGENGTGLVTTYDYDRNNNLIYMRDPNGNVTTNGYDQLNRFTEIAFFDGSDTNVLPKCTKKFWYDLRSNKTWEKEENDHYTFYQYDEFNNLTHTVRVMDPAFNPSLVSGTYAYTPNTALDIVTSSAFNPDGTLAHTVDPRGLRSEFLYDDLRRLTNSIVDPGVAPHLNYSTSYAYSTNENYCGGITLPPYKFTPTLETDPRGYKMETIYDALNRPIENWAEVTNGVMSKLATMGYDAVGNLHSSTNWVDGNVANCQVTETRYDGLNRPYQVINPDGTEVGIRYTSTGLKWQTTNELDRVSAVIYDLAGRPVKTISPVLEGGSRAISQTEYDANGNVWKVTDPVAFAKAGGGPVLESSKTVNTYDYRNRLLETIAPLVYNASSDSYEQPIVSSVYDRAGNVVSVTDANENTTTNFYDAANRLYETWAPEVMVYGEGMMRPVTTNGYDKGGNIILTRDANEKTVRMQYDIVGRLTNTIDAINNTISFAYDANGNQTALTDGNTNTTTFVYDCLNRKTRTSYPGDTTHEDAVYDLVGNRVKRIDCNGKETQYDFDDRNLLKFVTYPKVLISGFIQGERKREYGYDAVGNLETVTEKIGHYFLGTWSHDENLPNAAVSYTYDALNRVDSETSVGVTHEYSYDLNGNRTDATYGLTGRQVEWEYDALNRISEIRDLTSYAGTNTVASGENLQEAIDAAGTGDLVLVGNGAYGPVVLTNAVTLKSENGPGATSIQATASGRAAHLSNGAQLIGFTLTGGTLTGGTLGGTNSGAGAFVDAGCLISDCVISNNQTAVCSDVTIPGGKGGGLYLRGTALRCTIVDNTAWNGAGVFLESGANMADCTISSNAASGVNSYGGGLYLQDGTTAVNCLIENNMATDGGGLFFEQGGYAQDIGSISNAVDSIGGAGAFLWAGGTLRNGLIEGNAATGNYARGGAGIMFFDEGGLVEDSIIIGNNSITNGGVHYHFSGTEDPGQLGTLNNSILWNNGSQSTVWAGTGNQTTDPASVTNAATGAHVEAYSYANAETRTTAYFYDLNGNAVKRVYPTRVEETRSFDAMNRLLTLKTETIGRDWFEIAYEYDAVGSLCRLEHTRSTSLAGKAPAAVYSWGYDDRYRLTSEDLDIAGGTNYVTSYTWDNADNRLTKKEYANDVLSADITYTNNALNQLTGWHDTVKGKEVSYTYDDNGARTTKTVVVGGTNTAVTSYTYDEDNRLIHVDSSRKNLIYNGDFEEGNTGFGTGYTYDPSGYTSAQGVYTVGNNSSEWGVTVPSTAEHTSGSGLMLMGRGATSTNTVVWQQNVDVIAGVEYEFSGWVASLHSSGGAPELQFEVDGQIVGNPIVGTFNVWNNFSATWTSAVSGSVTLSIRDNRSAYIGNLFGLDDLSFSPISSTSTHTFAYDYRSRRYYRATSTETNICVFDGGLSIQEYDATTSITPHASRLTTEFIRGEGMGGGVGGMVYSISKDGDGKNQILCSHANHRGDIIARSNESGELTSFALYEAYGTRPYEWGDDPDRQKANTKEEESDLNILNEGMRPRDLETGVFLTRDPIGYGDGPNVYCYVHCNPITRFDPLGLAGYFFDGTGNDGDDDDKGNSFVYALHDAYEGKNKFYQHGVGTRTDIAAGNLFGKGAKERMDAMYEDFKRAYESGDTEIDIFGFSRGAGMAREFANRIADSHPDAEIRFLGLFDTVAQIGLPDDFNNNPGVRLDIPDNVQYTFHAVARHEQRSLFPLTSIVKGYQGQNTTRGYKEQFGPKFWEKPFDGVHSEIGGGYKDGKVNMASLRYMSTMASFKGAPINMDQLGVGYNYTHAPNAHDETKNWKYAGNDALRFTRRVFQGNLKAEKR